MNTRVLTLCFSVLAGAVYADDNMAHAQDGMTVDPNLYVDLETPPDPYPYVISEDSMHQLFWSDVEEMLRTGNYGDFTPSFIFDACRVFTSQRGSMVDTYPRSQNHLPRAGYACPDPSVPTS